MDKFEENVWGVVGKTTQGYCQLWDVVLEALEINKGYSKESPIFSTFIMIFLLDLLQFIQSLINSIILLPEIMTQDVTNALALSGL